MLSRGDEVPSFLDVIEGVKEIPVWGAIYSPPERNDGGPEVAVFVKAGQVCSCVEGHAVGCQEQVDGFRCCSKFLDGVIRVFLELF